MATPCGGRQQAPRRTQPREILRSAVREMAEFRPLVRASDKTRTTTLR
jgi:hypothetical protein